MPKRLWLLFLVCLTSIGSALAQVPPASATRSAPLGDPVASEIEGVPIPSSAVRDPGLTKEGLIVGYRVPLGVKRAALLKWYDKQLPKGATFHGWQWCDDYVSKGMVQRMWTHRGTSDILSVVLSFDRDPKIEDGILVSRDKSGPCT